MNQRVLVASNRGPVSYQFGADGSLTGSRGGGGMIAGVADGLAALGPGASATWICAALSDADRAVARARDTSDGNGIPVRMAVFAVLLGVDHLVAGSLRDATWRTSPRR